MKGRARSRTDARKNQITPVENARGMVKKVGSCKNEVLIKVACYALIEPRESCDRLHSVHRMTVFWASACRMEIILIASGVISGLNSGHT